MRPLTLSEAAPGRVPRSGTLKFISFRLQSMWAPSPERLLNAEVFVRSRHFNDRFCNDWEFLAEVPAHGIGKKFVPGPSENGGTGRHGFSRATTARSTKGL